MFIEHLTSDSQHCQDPQNKKSLRTDYGQNKPKETEQLNIMWHIGHNVGLYKELWGKVGHLDKLLTFIQDN
jgi:hypothetical protein